MATIKIRLNTWQRCGNRDTKFKRNLAPREGFVDICPKTKKVIVKPGETKWKPFDTSLSRKTDKEYIQNKKKLYEGLCFDNRKQAKEFMLKHKTELDQLAKQNPLFNNWSVMNVIKRFEPSSRMVYGKDIKE